MQEKQIHKLASLWIQKLCIEGNSKCSEFANMSTCKNLGHLKFAKSVNLFAVRY